MNICKSTHFRSCRLRQGQHHWRINHLLTGVRRVVRTKMGVVYQFALNQSLHNLVHIIANSSPNHRHQEGDEKGSQQPILIASRPKWQWQESKEPQNATRRSKGENNEELSASILHQRYVRYASNYVERKMFQSSLLKSRGTYIHNLSQYIRSDEKSVHASTQTSTSQTHTFILLIIAPTTISFTRCG